MEENKLNIINNPQIQKLEEKPLSEMKGSEIQDRNMDNYKNNNLDSFRPSVIWIEPTNFCNLRCTMCPHSDGTMTRKKGFMNIEVFKQIIDEVKEWKPAIKLFHLGESFIHPKIEEMIVYASKAGCFTMLNTNGNLIDQKKAEMILDSGLDYLSFSLDGATKETYEKIRVGGNYEETLNNMVNFLELKKERQQRKPFVNIEMIHMKDTEDEVSKFRETFSKLPADNVGIKRLNNWAGEVVVEGEMKRVTTDMSCIHPWSFSVVLWDGKIVPCCKDFNGAHVLGDVRENKLMDIWNKHYKMLYLRETLGKEGGFRDIDICKGCSEIFIDRIGTDGEEVKMLG
tara:strand:- start:1730 stop:2752 length:1023 start_codon:yes stop_codon:yes gene_type:complete